MTTDISQLVEPLRALDWNDVPKIEATTGKVLESLAADRDLLRRAVEAVPDDERLCKLAEHYDILDKIVLHDDDLGFRIRLHVFLPGYYDRPHNHRWTYSSRLLRGSYQHTLYGLDDDLDEDTPVADLKPYMVRTEQAGHGYTLHHGMIHAAVAEPYTVSLIVRGPAMKDRFLVADRATGESWWQYGAASEPKKDAQNKRMTGDQIRHATQRLTELGII
ncbi:hypothetical protein [Streptomyces sp. TR02-1]|uniref:hypothetical protein n=1 Tax=Streptomyces sp. TR02-1 TaxID=3385977 RepID=UPI0039A0A692